MRTTLTLEPDVSALLERIRLEKKLGLKEAINEALRLGLRDLSSDAAPRSKHYRIQPVSLCPRQSEMDDIEETIAVAEARP